MTRSLVVLAGLCAGLGLGADAAGHGGEAAPGYRATVSTVEPNVPGLLVRVLGRDALSVRNWSGKRVVVASAAGEPLFRFTADAVHRRNGSGWKQVKRGTSHAWHDERLRAEAPPPERSGTVGDFEIQGTADGTPFTIFGFIGYRAPEAEGGNDGSRLWPIVPVGGLVLLVLAALALPLVMRREGEDAKEEIPTEGSSGTR